MADEFRCFREESRDEWGAIDDKYEIDDEDIRTGALLRIADALERAYPEKVDPGDEKDDAETEARSRAYAVYLLAKGFTEEDLHVPDWPDLSRGCKQKLSGRLYMYLPNLLDRCSYHLYDWTPAELASLRAALKARGLYLWDEWPDDGD